MRRTRILALAVAGGLAACAADAPARSTPSASPKVAEAPTLPHLFAEKSPVSDGAQLHAYEADSRLVLWLLGREGETHFVVSGGEPITGFAAAPNRAVLFDALAARDGIGIARVGAGTRKDTVSMSEPGISSLTLLETIAGKAGATKGVRVSVGVALPEVSVFVRDVRADALVAAIATATSTKIELAGGQLLVTGTPGRQTGAPSGVKAISASELADVTLLATVVDARHQQALLGTSAGPRVAVDSAAVLEIEDGRASAGGRMLTVVPPPQTPAESEAGTTTQSASKVESTSKGKTRNSNKKESFGAANDGGTGGGAGGGAGDPDGGTSPASSTDSFGFSKAVEEDQSGLKAPAPGLPPQRQIQPALNVATPAAGSAAWAVEPFKERAGWLGTHEAALARKFRGASWGDAFALALERSLRERGRNAKAVPQKLSDPQIKKLVEEQKLRWIVAGDLKALAVKEDKIASLSIGLNVRKQTGPKFTPVDARTIEVAMPIGAAAPTDEDLLALMRACAEKAADAVVLTIPSDLLAGRN